MKIKTIKVFFSICIFSGVFSGTALAVQDTAADVSASVPQTNSDNLKLEKIKLEKEIVELEMQLLKRDLEKEKQKRNNQLSPEGQKARREKFKTFIDNNPGYIEFPAGYYHFSTADSFAEGLSPHSTGIGYSMYVLFNKRFLLGMMGKNFISTDFYNSDINMYGDYSGPMLGVNFGQHRVKCHIAVSGGTGNYNIYSQKYLKTISSYEVRFAEISLGLNIAINEKTAIGIKPFYLYNFHNASDAFGGSIMITKGSYK